MHDNMKPRHHVRNQLKTIFEDGLHGVNQKPPQGFLRGVEVLGDDLAPAMIRSVRAYQRKHGWLPDLIAPKTFTEKQVLFKFFGLVPEHSPSDKLRSAGFVPPALRDTFEIPKRIWVSDKAELPGNGEIPDGGYYFKSNHSSGTNKAISFPISDQTRAEEEARAQQWLTRKHNEKLALWWYETMPRNVYIEEDLSLDDGDAPDWKFFVCNGRVELFQVDTGRYSDHIQTIYNRDGSYVEHELYFKTGDPLPMPDCLPDMVALAEGIGQSFDFIRVDMFILRGKVYLGEIALVPNGARTRIRSPELDERLGQAWNTPWMGQVSKDWAQGHYRNVAYSPWPD